MPISMQTIVGYWDLDLETRQLSLCPRSRAMLGIVPNSPALLDESEWLRSVHPDDITVVFEQINSAQRNRQPYLQEFRSVHTNGSEHFILGVGRAVGARGRKSQRFVGFNIGLGLATGALEEQPRTPRTTLNELLSWRPHSQLSNWVRPALTTDEIEAVIEQLTQAQIDCLLLVDQQLNSKQIARRLGISPHTVDQRIRAALRILHCDRRVHAARLLASRVPNG
jgi:DNA-binding CsgD family transcriptional regulator